MAKQLDKLKRVDNPGDLFSKVPPQNLEAERSLLGSVLLVNETIDDVLNLINAEHFYSPANQVLFKTIHQMYERGERAIDAITLSHELQRDNKLEEVGGTAYLLEVMETVPHAAHVDYYARIVKEAWLQRTLIYTCNDILTRAFEPGEDVEKLLGEAEQRIFTIAESKTQINSFDIKSILMETWDRINERSDQEEATTGIPTGFIALDDLTTGYQPSELIILAARPSMGKTAFVCNSTLAMALHQKSVLLFSLEQSKLELAERLLCIHSKVDGHKVRQGTIDEVERHSLLEGSGELQDCRITIDDTPGRTISQITAIARRVKRSIGLDCVVIDYLQLIEAEDKNQPREQQISAITRRLKFLAKEQSIPVIALSQLNRGVDQRENKTPRLSDLRESGAIEQDADIVMFLHRPEAYNPEDRPGEADVIVAKNRSGPVGTAKLTWIKNQLRFADYSPLNEPEGGFMDDGF